jgi:putative spermidine/putrescine transport system permease protein
MPLRPNIKILLLLLPILGILVSFLIIPLIMLFAISFKHYARMNIVDVFTVENYALFLDPYYFGCWLNSIRLSVVVTALCLVLGYPAAYYLLRRSSKTLRSILYALVVFPLITSVIVRAYGWMVILSDSGLLNSLLIALHLIDKPIRLLWTFETLYITVTHVELPFMILSLVSALQDVDPTLELAAKNLGANRLKTFVKVTLPLSSPGIIAGSMLVFMLSMGIYITPYMTGGAQMPILSLAVYGYVYTVLNFPAGGALAFILLATSLCIAAIIPKVTKLALRLE